MEVERPSDQSWDAAADELLQKLHEAGVQKGQACSSSRSVCAMLFALNPDFVQVLSIDAHTGDLISPAILLAVTGLQACAWVV